MNLQMENVLQNDSHRRIVVVLLPISLTVVSATPQLPLVFDERFLQNHVQHAARRQNLSPKWPVCGLVDREPPQRRFKL